ncbi:helix-turn-helix domain-containing protein [Thalassobellus citreus]|uniref:helix-turn-helix domain-containing protein n=1 Tax=Thalassobellus citreus TaxID=3367752 RepID=UPI0037BB07B1
MANTNINWTSMSDKSIIESIGSYIKQQRLNKNKTQAQTAEHAGVNRWTISQIENGEAISLTSLVQILRALDLLHVFNSFKIETQISPLELAKLEKQKRQRARNKNNNTQTESEW